MDRKDWLKKKRRLAEERYDNIFSENYDSNWGQIDPSHNKVVTKILELTPRSGSILDAACGTGKYWKMILEKDVSLMGIDQSEEMLRKAESKFPQVKTRKLGLQEIDYTEQFDSIICIDAMENIPPEDWPQVLNNFFQALKKSGHLYFTVELISDEDVEEAFLEGKRMGLPIVKGEHAHQGGYHYYPTIEQVRDWTVDVGFRTIEGRSGDGYHHLLLTKYS